MMIDKLWFAHFSMYILLTRIREVGTNTKSQAKGGKSMDAGCRVSKCGAPCISVVSVIAPSTANQTGAIWRQMTPCQASLTNLVMGRLVTPIQVLMIYDLDI